jgi:hypothetical protein
MQRRVAEERRLNSAATKPAASPNKVRFRAVDHDRESLSPSLTVSGQRSDQTQSSRLLERLRQALAPTSERERQEQNLASRAYSSLQDELLRLTAHIQQGRDRQAIDESLRDLELPLEQKTELGLDEIPCSKIRIIFDNQNAHPGSFLSILTPVQIPGNRLRCVWRGRDARSMFVHQISAGVAGGDEREESHGCHNKIRRECSCAETIT